MNRVRFSFAATVGALALGVAASAAQGTAAPPMKSVLAGKKLTPPVRGEVTVEYTSPVRKAVGDMIITTFQVRNINVAPIARLTITQSWFDKSNNVIGGGKGAVEGLLQPNEIKTITIESPKKAEYNADGFNFTHANGTVKAKLVAKMTPAATTTAAKPATTAPAKK